MDDFKYLRVEDVQALLGISSSTAYKIMRQVNKELEKKGFITIRGRVHRDYLVERVGGGLCK